MNGNIFFDMRKQVHPTYGRTVFLLKRWRRHTVYSKSGSYVRANYLKSGSYGWNGKENVSSFENGAYNISHNYSNIKSNGTYFHESSPPSSNWYQTCSIYLYDYVVVSDKFFYENVYTSSVVNTDPNYEGPEGNNPFSNPDNPYVPLNKWYHRDNTFKNTMNSITNNWVFRFNPEATAMVGHTVYGDVPAYYVGSEEYNTLMKTPIYKDDGTYFEIVKGYPRNHFTHKRDLFSLYSMRTFGMVNRVVTSGSYVRNRQTIASTIGIDGLEDGTPPVQSIDVGNLKLIQTDNVINH